jgi:hypothetical protein
VQQWREDSTPSSFTPPPPRSPRPSLDPMTFPCGEQICYHVIDKYRYADFIDVKLVE